MALVLSCQGGEVVFKGSDGVQQMALIEDEAWAYPGIGKNVQDFFGVGGKNGGSQISTPPGAGKGQ